MAIYAGKLRMQGVDMDEIVPFGVDLFKSFAHSNEIHRSIL
jgi:hypothetical protein